MNKEIINKLEEEKKEILNLIKLYTETNNERIEWRECARFLYEQMSAILRVSDGVSIEDYDLFEACKSAQNYKELEKKYLKPIKKAAKAEEL